MTRNRINETPDDPSRKNGRVSNSEWDGPDAITFSAFPTFTLYGHTAGDIYHCDLVDAYDHVMQRLVQIRAIDERFPDGQFPEKIQSIIRHSLRISLAEFKFLVKDLKGDGIQSYIKRELKEYGIGVSGEIPADKIKIVPERSNYRRFGVLNGRFWYDKSFISFWDEDEVVAKNIHICVPLIKHFQQEAESSLIVDDVMVDMEPPVGKERITVGDLLNNPEEASKIKMSSADRSKLIDLQKKAHNTRDINKLKNDMKSLIKKNLDSKSMDIDKVASQLVNKLIGKAFMGSKVDYNRAKSAGYDTVAQRNASQPALEEHNGDLTPSKQPKQSKEDKDRVELMRQYHTETDPLRKKSLAKRLGMLKPAPRKFGMSQWKADSARGITESKFKIMINEMYGSDKKRESLSERLIKQCISNETPLIDKDFKRYMTERNLV